MNFNEAMDNCIFRFIAGSHAYGTNNEESDQDFRGVFIAPIKYAFELFQTSFVSSGSINENIKEAQLAIEEYRYIVALEYLKRARMTDQGDLNFAVETVRNPESEDEELQELRKFLKLATECNPNIIEFLYVDRLITHQTKEWDLIKAHRHYFLSKKARWSFSGYAIAQMKKIQLHRNYLLNPPAHRPTRKEFGLPEHTTIPKEFQSALLSVSDEYIKSNLKDLIIKEKQFKIKNEEWNAYQKWASNRNKKRQKMEAQYGYDLKHAMHLVRLCNMANEILTDQTISVYRPDRELLLNIRNGEWPFEKLLDFANGVDTELDQLYKVSSLRDKPDYKGIAELYKEICKMRYGIII